MPPAARDPWLDRWLPLIRERAGERPVLEIGCGSGRDTATLAHAGLSVIGIDISPEGIELARRSVPEAVFCLQDLRDPFPQEAGPAGVIVASLSLHYFEWTTTLELAERIRTTLRPGGILLCRLNSTRDAEYGAVGHPRINENLYLVDGHPKRFFDLPAVEALFPRGWRPLSTEELVIDRYARPKVVWEIILERGA